MIPWCAQLVNIDTEIYGCVGMILQDVGELHMMKSIFHIVRNRDTSTNTQSLSRRTSENNASVDKLQNKLEVTTDGHEVIDYEINKPRRNLNI